MPNSIEMYRFELGSKWGHTNIILLANDIKKFG